MRWIAVIVSVVTLGCTAKTCPNCGKPYEADAAVVLKQSHDATDEIASTISSIDAAIRVASHNMANAETTGFKRTDAKVAEGGKLTIQLDFEQGGLQNTGRNMDIGIQGDGFFRVKVSPQLGDGWGYTRNGALGQNSNGELVIAIEDGYRIDPPVTIPPNAVKVEINTDGAISYSTPGSTSKTKAGRIALYQFTNPQGLSHLKTAIFQMNDSSGEAIESTPGEGGAGMTLQGFLEASNVDKVKEQVRLNYLTNWRNDLMEIAKKMSPSILIPNISQK